MQSKLPLFLSFFFSSFLVITEVVAQDQAKIDSLKNVFETAQHDTIKVQTLLRWDNLIYASDPDLDLKLNLTIDSISSIHLNQTLSPAEKSVYLETKSISNGNLGLIYNAKGENTKALNYLFKAVEVRKISDDKKAVAYAYNNIGAIYNEQGMHNKAIEYYTKSLVIHEEIGNQRGIGGALNNIAIIHKSQGNFASAIDFYKKSIAVKKENNDSVAIAIGYLNLGSLYLEVEKYDTARIYLQKTLEISEAKNDPGNSSRAFVNLGTIYQKKSQLDSALYFIKKGYEIQKELNDQKVLAETAVNLGKVYFEMGEIESARVYALQALELATKNDVIKVEQWAAELLYRIYKKRGQSALSLEMLELSIRLKEQITSAENQKEVIRQQYKYAYEKQAVADSIKAAEEAKLKDAELEAEQVKALNQKQQKYFLFGLLGLALVSGGFVFNRYRITRNQKNIIEQQKQKVDLAFEILEEKNKEIFDSINYAQRIQHSFLASNNTLNDGLNDYFIYFNPKEAVSGDFYWAGKLANGNFAISCADSTGHGVPGAIMSILNISSIERAVEKGLTKPADIFNETRKLIIERLKLDGSPDGGKDGMDATLLSLNLEKNKLEYVAANNPIWILRKGELIDLKAEKMPVGKHHHDNIPFEGGTFDLYKGDIIYTATDGYQDQFGGPKGKKFKVKPMKNLLMEIADLPIHEQKQKLATTFEAWKGTQEQVDDVCVVGIRI